MLASHLNTIFEARQLNKIWKPGDEYVLLLLGLGAVDKLTKRLGKG
jgi:hypothetical protein